MEPWDPHFLSLVERLWRTNLIEKSQTLRMLLDWLRSKADELSTAELSLIYMQGTQAVLARLDKEGGLTEGESYRNLKTELLSAASQDGAY